MEYKNIVVEVGEDHVAVITLNRPSKLNTFTVELATELYEALKDMDKDERVRVILLKGEGKVFCAGIDVGDFFDKSALEYREWIEIMERPLVGMAEIKKPVITQVHGVAAANGAGLVAASDLCIAAEGARFGLTAINVGLNCVGPVVPVLRSVGRKRALEMLLFGDLIPAEDALSMGLINKVVPGEELEDAARNWACELAKKSPIAVQLAKRAFYMAEDMDYRQAFAYMNEVFSLLCSTEDAKEGVCAFLEKRKPSWKER